MNWPEAPGYLDQNLTLRWYQLAPIAARNGTLTNCSVDAFARYVIAEQQYLRATQRVFDALRAGDTSDAAAWSQIQDRLFRELQASGKIFGLTPDTDLLR